MGALELFRRAALAAGVCGGLWYALWSPPVLIEVRRARFAEEYERRYAERQYPMAGVMEMGREFLRRNTHPGSLEAFIARSTEGRLLPFGGDRWSDLFRRLERPAWFSPYEPPVNELRADIEQVYRRASWSTMYLPVRDGYLEFRYETRPRKSAAGTALVYPYRGRGLLWLAGGLALWLLLPWPRRGAGAVACDLVPVRVLDLFSASLAGAFFALPLFFAYSTAEAMGEDLGSTIFCWTIAGAAASVLVWTARMSAWAVRAVPGGLRVDGLAGSRTLPFSQMTGAGYLIRGDVQTGYFVRMSDGSVLRIPWSGVSRPEAAAYALATARIPHAGTLPA